MDKKITCIITAYNNFEYIYNAIDSVLIQTYPKIELIICDDCSECFPEENLVAYIEENKSENIIAYMVYSNPENYGTVKSFNNAIKKATGDVFINLSADDAFFDKNVFANVKKLFDDTGALCATCRVIMTGGNSRIDGRSFQTEKQISQLKKMTPPQFFNRIVKDNISIGASHYFVRKALDRFGYFDEQYKYIEDLPRFLRISAEGYRVHFFDLPTVYHRMDGISNSKIVPLRYIVDNLMICRNEILGRKELLSKFSYRYNLCREESLVMRINNRGSLSFVNRIVLAIKYPDAAVYNVYAHFQLLYGKRKRYQLK